MILFFSPSRQLLLMLIIVKELFDCTIRDIFANMAGTTRQQKFAKFIQKELSDIFHQNKRGFLDNIFVTLTEVQVSPDLSVAKVFISMMLIKDKQQVLEKINAHKKDIRRELGMRIGRQVRIIPELIFYIDEVEENAAKIENLIKSLNIPPADKDTTDK